jgi:hypothetical protein
MKLETAAFGYLRERLYSEQRVAGNDLWLSATCAVLVPASDGSHVFSKPGRCFRSVGPLIATRCSIRMRNPKWRSTHPLAAMHFGPTDTQTALGTISESARLIQGDKGDHRYEDQVSRCDCDSCSCRLYWADRQFFPFAVARKAIHVGRDAGGGPISSVCGSVSDAVWRLIGGVTRNSGRSSAFASSHGTRIQTSRRLRDWLLVTVTIYI